MSDWWVPASVLLVVGLVSLAFSIYYWRLGERFLGEAQGLLTESLERNEDSCNDLDQAISTLDQARLERESWLANSYRELSLYLKIMDHRDDVPEDIYELAMACSTLRKRALEDLRQDRTGQHLKENHNG